MESNKCREEFEKWGNSKGMDLTTGTLDGRWKDKYIYSSARIAWQGFQAAYNLREQEIQRLREVLKKIKDVTDGNTLRGEDYFDDVDFIGEIVDQALQKDLTTTK